MNDRIAPTQTVWEVNGRAILDTSGKPLRRPERERIFVPVCSPCNSGMNDHVELPAQAAIQRLAPNGWQGVCSADEWRAIGVWWAKILLLLRHPDIWFGTTRLGDEVKPFLEGLTADYRWLATGGMPPTSVSVFAFHGDLSDPTTALLLPIPEFVATDSGGHAACQTLTVATQGICVAVVYHPGINVEHPLVDRGDAWELLHCPPSGRSIDELPLYPYRHVAIAVGGFADEGAVANVATDPMSWLVQHEHLPSSPPVEHA